MDTPVIDCCRGGQPRQHRHSGRRHHEGTAVSWLHLVLHVDERRPGDVSTGHCLLEAVGGAATLDACTRIARSVVAGW